MPFRDTRSTGVSNFTSMKSARSMNSIPIERLKSTMMSMSLPGHCSPLANDPKTPMALTWNRRSSSGLISRRTFCMDARSCMGRFSADTEGYCHENWKSCVQREGHGVVDPSKVECHWQLPLSTPSDLRKMDIDRKRYLVHQCRSPRLMDPYMDPYSSRTRQPSD